jgi:Fur family transcriptional regulator, ferric uptake regulator
MASASADLADLLRRKGVRPTRQRLAVLAELADEPNDATAQELWRRLHDRSDSSLGLATVYRTLAVLRENDVIDALSHHGGELCYRLCAETHHHHLVCVSCHRVIEIDECDLDDWIDRVASRSGFAATEHRLEIEGLCSDCRAA